MEKNYFHAVEANKTKKIKSPSMKIFCVGRNYVDHAKEMKNEVPTEPVIFLKPKTALLVPGTPFYYPEFTNELHYEAELVLKVCKNGKYISEEQASNYYNAVTVGIDFTARDLQREYMKKGLPWEKSKAFDCSAVVGKWVDYMPSIFKAPLNFSMTLNGNTVQQASSSEMIFNFNRIISDISQYFGLNIGDYIFTGTPAGVGECVVGDVLEGFLGDTKVFEVEVN